MQPIILRLNSSKTFLRKTFFKWLSPWLLQTVLRLRSFGDKRLLDLGSLQQMSTVPVPRGGCKHQIFLPILSSTNTGKENAVAALMCAKLLVNKQRRNRLCKVFTNFLLAAFYLSLTVHVEKCKGKKCLHESRKMRLILHKLMGYLPGKLV